ncbi:hypothetical protein AAKU67_004272 [Oxalobacteraceae bacterium GrIS 2.11]
MNLLRTKIHTAFSNDLERSRTTMQWGGLLGTIAHPIYYFIWTYRKRAISHTLTPDPTQYLRG